MRYARDSVYSVPVLRSQGPSIIFYMVSSQEIITLSSPGTAPIQTGEFFQQAMISFTNSTLNADAVAYSSGFQSSSAGPDVSIGLVTLDGMPASCCPSPAWRSSSPPPGCARHGRRAAQLPPKGTSWVPDPCHTGTNPVPN